MERTPSMHNLEPQKIRAIESAIMDILSGEFHGVELLRVSVTEDVDFDGDDILKVDVVFAGKPKDINPSYMTGAIRNVLPKLSEMEVLAFPMMSFISEKDAQVANR